VGAANYAGLEAVAADIVSLGGPLLTTICRLAGPAPRAPAFRLRPQPCRVSRPSLRAAACLRQLSWVEMTTLGDAALTPKTLLKDGSGGEPQESNQACRNKAQRSGGDLPLRSGQRNQDSLQRPSVGGKPKNASIGKPGPVVTQLKMR